MSARTIRVILSSLPGLLTLTLGTFLVRTSHWQVFGVPTTGKHFGDLKVMLFASECARQDSGWSISSTPCMPEMAIYNYPSLWAKVFALLGINSNAATQVTLVFILLFAIALSALTFIAVRPGNRWFPVIAMAIVAVSPPVLLAFERGNIDLVIFVLTVASVILLISGLVRTSAIALGVATSLKLFPLGSVLMFLPFRPRRTSALVVYALVTLLGLALIARDLPTIYARTPALDGASFGSSVLLLLSLNHLGLANPVTMAKALGIVLFIVVAAGILLLSHGRKDRVGVGRLSNDIQSDPIALSLVLAGGGSFLVAYLIGPSFDYRLITLIPFITGLACLGNGISRVAALVVVTQMILSYSTFIGAAEYFSDLMLLVIAPYLFVLLVTLIQRSVRTPRLAPTG